MKKISTLILLAISILSIKAQQVQNPGFETWSNNFPSGWGSHGEMIYNGMGFNPNTDVQTTDSHSGTYAILMQNQYIALAGSYVPGGINTGPIDLGSGQPTRGFQAYTGEPISYEFYYKFNAIGGDSAFTFAFFTKWNSGLNKRDTVAAAMSYILGPVNSYTQLSVPVYWLMPGTAPDSIQLYISSSVKRVGSGGTQPPVGGQLFVDDVYMMTPTGVTPLFTETSQDAFPNPASGNIKIVINNQGASKLFVYDIAGREIETYVVTADVFNIDLSSYKNGLYIYKVMDINNNVLKSSRFAVVK